MHYDARRSVVVAWDAELAVLGFQVKLSYAVLYLHLFATKAPNEPS